MANVVQIINYNIASILEKICNEVVVEPMLQPCTGESLRNDTCLEDGARLDIAA